MPVARVCGNIPCKCLIRLDSAASLVQLLLHLVCGCFLPGDTADMDLELFVRAQCLAVGQEVFVTQGLDPMKPASLKCLDR